MPAGTAGSGGKAAAGGGAAPAAPAAKGSAAASELARNTLRYGGGGEARIVHVREGLRQGLELSFVDAGPGIDDISLALSDGYTSGGGLGLGLGGAKRLADAFHIDTAPGSGTTVTIAKWKLF